MTSKQYRKIKKIYKKKFKILYKQLLNSKVAGLALFIEQLSYILTIETLTQEGQEAAQDRLATLEAALAEFKEYTNAMADNSGSSKKFHWNIFCDFFKQNAEG